WTTRILGILTRPSYHHRRRQRGASRQVGAAVDENRLTVHVCGVVREQERHHGRDVLWDAETRGPHRGKDLIPVFLVQDFHGGCSQRDPWRHDVAADAVLATD